MEAIEILLDDQKDGYITEERYAIDFGLCSYASEQNREIDVVLRNRLAKNEILLQSFAMEQKNNEGYYFPGIVTMISWTLTNSAPVISSDVMKSQSIAPSADPSQQSSIPNTGNNPFLYDICIPPLGICRCRLSFRPIVSVNDMTNPLTSYFTVKSKGTFIYKILPREDQSYQLMSSDIPEETGQVLSTIVLMRATLCMSILHIDTTDLDFGECILGESTSKTIQLWNRSECPLNYKVYRDCDDDPNVLDAVGITMQSGDGNKLIYPCDTIQILATFASQRIKVNMTAKSCGHFNLKVVIENTENQSNRVTLTCKVDVINKDQVVMDPVSIIDDSTKEGNNTGYVINLGKVYYERLQTKTLHLVNRFSQPISISLQSSEPLEVFLSSADAGISSDAIDTMEMAFTSKLYKYLEKDPKKFNLGMFGMSKRMLDEFEANESAARHTKSSSIGVAEIRQDNSTISRGTADIPSSPTPLYTELWVHRSKSNDMDTTNNTKENFANKLSSSKASTEKKLPKKGIYDAITSCSTIYGYDYSTRIPFVDYESRLMSTDPNALYVDVWSRRHLQHRCRRFLGQTSHKRQTITPSYVSSIPTGQSLSPSRHLKKSALKSILNYKDASSLEHIDSNFEIILPANSKTPIVLYYRPSQSPSNNVNTAKIPASATLTSKNFKLILKWQNPVDQSNETTLSPSYENLRTYTCKAQCCLSFITISPFLQDLKECSVGNFYSTKFTITNHSDLPTSIVPHIESETLSVARNQSQVIEPLETISFQFDYVAQLENTNYHRKIVFLNEFNPMNHHLVEVQAKNIDTQQVLQHSKYYKIVTGNQKKQLQIYYDLCVYNVPNVRSFKIINIAPHPIILKISTKNETDEMKPFKHEDIILYSYIQHIHSVDSRTDSSPLSEEIGSLDAVRIASNIDEARKNQYSYIENKPRESTNRIDRKGISEQRIEDLKWGSPRDTQSTIVSNKTHSSNPLTSVSMRLSFDNNPDDFMNPTGKPRTNSISDEMIVHRISNMAVGDLATNISGSYEANHNTSIKSLMTKHTSLDKYDTINRFSKSSVNVLENSLDSSADQSQGPGLGKAPNRMLVRSGSNSHLNEYQSNKTSGDIPPSTNIHDDMNHEMRWFESALYHASSDGYPFSYIENQLQVTTQEPDKSIEELLDSCIREVKKTITCFETLSTSTNRVAASGNQSFEKALSRIQDDTHIVLPVGVCQEFVILFNPLSDGTNDSNINNIHRFIQISMISSSDSNSNSLVSSHDLNLDHTFPETCSSDSKDLIRTLKPRSLLIRGKVCRSEMSLLQRNINFGKLIISETSTKSVSITNRSAIPLLYGISKSGSIQSGFLRIPSGRRGKIAPKSTLTIDFILKPTLSGNFEEVIQIYNILDRKNSENLIVKAKVKKPEVFLVSIVSPSNSLLNISSTSSKLNNLGEKTTLERSKSISGTDLSESQEKYEVEKVSVSNQMKDNCISLGIGAVGLQLEKEIVFTIHNVSARKRLFIIDANHMDAIVLNQKVINQENKQEFELFEINEINSSPQISHSNNELNSTASIGYYQNIIALRCHFDVRQINLNNGVKLSEEETQTLSDKLEKFHQKLKIAVRKNKPEKIVKYEKKIKQVQDILSGKSSVTGLDEDDDKEETEDDRKVAPNTETVDAGKQSSSTAATAAQSKAVPENQTIASGLRIVAKSDVSLYFDLEADAIAEVRVLITCIPSSAYRSWKGQLPFQGHLRIFEARNEDHIKTVSFDSHLYSSSKTMYSDPNNQMLVPNQTLHNLDLTSSLLFPSTQLMSSNATKFRPVNEVMIITVSQHTSFPTKMLFPYYRLLTQNVLGMSIQLVPINKSDNIMQGTFSIDSLSSRDASVNVYVMDNWSLVETCKLEDNKSNYKSHRNPSQSNVTSYSSEDISCYDSSKHGPMTITIVSTANDYDYMNCCSVSSATFIQNKKIDCFVHWQPPSDLVKVHKIIIGCICVQILLREDTISLQYIPFVCFLEKKSCFRLVEKYNFGEIHAGNKRMTTISIENISENPVHYYASLSYKNASTGSSNPLAVASIGRAVLKNGQIGVLAPKSTSQITIELITNQNKTGKFEQDLWIMSSTDRSDQKKISLYAKVTLDPSHYILFPDLVLKENSPDTSIQSYQTLDLGFVQLPIEIPSTSGSSGPSSSLGPTIPSSTSSGIPPTSTMNQFESNSITIDQLIESVQYLCPYHHKLSIENVSIMILYIEASTNLKNQCIIYIDESCQFPVNHSPLYPKMISYLYIVIRPSAIRNISSTSTVSSVTDSSNSIAGPNKGKNINSLISRELIGGIHMTFYTEASSSSASTPRSTEPLFDITLDFTAIVGRSVLAIESLNDAIMYTKKPIIPISAVISNTKSSSNKSSHNRSKETFKKFMKSSSRRVTFDIIEEEDEEEEEQDKSDIKSSMTSIDITQFHLLDSKVQLSNKSTIFPLKYEFLGDCKLIFIQQNSYNDMTMDQKIHLISQNHSINDSISEGKVLIVLFIPSASIDDSSSILASSEPPHSNLIIPPNKEITIHYGLLYDKYKISGYLRHKIIVRNCYTGDIQAIKISAFIDPGMVHNDYKRECDIENLNITATAPVLVQLKEKQAPPVCSPLTKSKTFAVNDSKDPLVYEVIGSTKSSICSWIIQNSSADYVTVTPVSDLPVLINIMPILPDKETKIPSSPYHTNDSNHFQTIHTTVRREDKSHRSLLTLTPGHWKGGLSKCGDSVTIQGKAYAKITISAYHGGILHENYCREYFNKETLQNGVSNHGFGIIALVHSYQALQSFYQPVVSNPSSAVSLQHSMQTITKSSYKGKDTSSQSSDTTKSNLFTMFQPISTPSSSMKDPPSLSSSPQTIKKEISSHASIEIIDVISLTRMSLQFVIPMIRICNPVISLGSLGCGKTLEFSLDIENISDVDVPIVIEGLPSWIQFNEIDNTKTESTQKSKGKSPNPLSRNMIEDSSSISTTSSKLDHFNRNGPSKAIKNKNSLIYQKLHLWLNDKSLLHRTSLKNDLSKLKETGEDDESAHSDSDAHDTVSKDGSDDSYASDDSHDKTSLTGLDEKGKYNQDHQSDEELEDLSMKVIHMSVRDQSLSRNYDEYSSNKRPTIENIYELNIENLKSIEIDDKSSNSPSSSPYTQSQGLRGHRSMSSAAGDCKRSSSISSTHYFSQNLIFVPAKSNYTVKLKAIAPRIESQALEHCFTVRNIATTLNNKTKREDVKVSLQVDSSKILDVLSPVGKPLGVSGPTSTPFITTISPILVPSPSTARPLNQVHGEDKRNYDYVADGFTMVHVMVKNVSKATLDIRGIVQISSRLANIVEFSIYLPNHRHNFISQKYPNNSSKSTIPDPSGAKAVQEKETILSKKLLSFELMVGEEAEICVLFRGKLGSTINVKNDINPLLYDLSYRGLLTKGSHRQLLSSDQDDNDDIVDDENEDNEGLMENGSQGYDSLSECHDSSRESHLSTPFLDDYIDSLSPEIVLSDNLDILKTSSLNQAKNDKPIRSSSGNNTLAVDDRSTPKSLPSSSVDNLYAKNTNNSSRQRPSVTLSTVSNVTKQEEYLGPILVGKLLMKAKTKTVLDNKNSSNLDDIDMPSLWKANSTFDTTMIDLVGLIHPQPILTMTLPPTSYATIAQGISSPSNKSINHSSSDFLVNPRIPELFLIPIDMNSSSLIDDLDVPTGVPILQPRDDFVAIILTNYNEKYSCKYSIVLPQPFRHPNMRLYLKDEHQKLDNKQELFHGYYDSFQIISIPDSGVISPKSSIQIQLKIIPSQPADAMLLLSTLGIQISDPRSTMTTLPSYGPLSYLMGKAVVTVHSEIMNQEFSHGNALSNRIHPPLSFEVNMISTCMIPIISTAPVSSVNRSKQHLGDNYITDRINTSTNVSNIPPNKPIHRGNASELTSSKVWSDSQNDPNSLISRSTAIPEQINPTTKNSMANSFPTIRVRGVTPSIHPIFRRIYYVSLGQQTQKQQFVEWLLTLENRSSISQIEFHIICMNTSTSSERIPRLQDKKIFHVGQPRGLILANDSSAVMLYCYRKHLGNHCAYIIIENSSSPGDIHLLFLSMEVIPSASTLMVSSNDLREISSLVHEPSEDKSLAHGDKHHHMISSIQKNQRRVRLNGNSESNSSLLDGSRRCSSHDTEETSQTHKNSDMITRTDLNDMITLDIQLDSSKNESTSSQEAIQVDHTINYDSHHNEYHLDIVISPDQLSSIAKDTAKDIKESLSKYPNRRSIALTIGLKEGQAESLSRDTEDLRPRSHMLTVYHLSSYTRLWMQDDDIQSSINEEDHYSDIMVDYDECRRVILSQEHHDDKANQINAKSNMNDMDIDDKAIQGIQEALSASNERSTQQSALYAWYSKPSNVLSQRLSPRRNKLKAYIDLKDDIVIDLLKHENSVDRHEVVFEDVILFYLQESISVFPSSPEEDIFIPRKVSQLRITIRCGNTQRSNDQASKGYKVLTHPWPCDHVHAAIQVLISKLFMITSYHPCDIDKLGSRYSHHYCKLLHDLLFHVMALSDYAISFLCYDDIDQSYYRVLDLMLSVMRRTLQLDNIDDSLYEMCGLVAAFEARCEYIKTILNI